MSRRCGPVERHTVCRRSSDRRSCSAGPAQVEDAQITADTPTLADGGGLSLNVDGQTPHAHALMKFPLLIGAGTGQVPAGAIVTSAILQVNCTNAGTGDALYRLTQDWIEDEATWNERAIGVPWASPAPMEPDPTPASSVTGDCTATGQRSIDITPLVQEWSGGAPNYGLVFVESGTDGIDFGSSESTSSPALSVVYKSSLQSIETQPVIGRQRAGELPDDADGWPDVPAGMSE